MPEELHVKTGGAWREVDPASVQPSVKISGTWHDLSDVYVNVAGVWHRSWPISPSPVNLDTSGSGFITHDTYWAGGAGDTGTSYPNSCGSGAPSFPRNKAGAVSALNVRTYGYAGAEPVITSGTQTVSYTASAFLDFGFHLWYSINGGTWTYAALLAGTHIWPGQGWLSNSGSFNITVPSASLVEFATTAGPCWQDYVTNGVVTLSFPNT